MNSTVKKTITDINCLATVVTYNPDIEKLNNCINSIIDLQKDIKIVIVDNFSNNFQHVLSLARQFSNVCVIGNDVNLGIAKALNQSIAFAQKYGIEWVLTCDQDSLMPKNLFIEYRDIVDLPDVGMVSPKVYDKNAKTYIDYKITKNRFSDVKECITSGSMVKIDAWCAVNGFDEYLFIDGVDFDFCFRLHEHGYRIIRSNNAILIHEIGDTKVKHIIGIKFFVQNHNAFRKYYIMRNRVYCDYKHYGKLRLTTYLYYIKLNLIVFLYENNKTEKVVAVKRGFFDGKTAGTNLVKKNI